MHGGVVYDVSVRLNLLQNSLKEIENVMNKLEPDSKGFKDLQKIVESITKDMERLQTQSSKPFGSPQQFKQTAKTIDSMEASFAKVQTVLDHISFKDLKLDDDQRQMFDDFKQQILDAKQTLDDFKNQTKNNLLSNADTKAFLEGINPKLIEKSLDEIIRAVDNYINNLAKRVNKSKEQLDTLGRQVQIGNNIEQFIKKGGLNAKGMTGLKFEEFFAETAKGIKFKAGQQNPFFEWLRESFNLSDAQINELRAAGSANKVFEKIMATDESGNNKFFQPQLEAASKAAKAQIEEQPKYDNLVAKQREATEGAKQVADAQQQVADKAEATGQVIQQIADTEEKAGKAAVDAAAGHGVLGSTLSAMDQQIAGFRSELEQTNQQFLAFQRQQQAFQSIKSAIVNFMGFNQVLNLTKRAVTDAANHIKELDTVMNGIAIVTDMSTSDLWNQVDTYSQMAQTYGVTIQGAYEVSKIYYQQGLETNDVLTLTNETLKLSKISGLDYATTTDYMTTAIRGFKMEMSDASRVVDVYSALAANTAVSQQELAEAMTRTASSMESVGTTFEDASAMIATIVAVTRESANNIGSAMKSIASRYGELTKNPQKLLDSEGEAMSFNKVDEALQSVGITMQTVDHQFRSFTEVIEELAQKWDTLDSTQQRYIATQFAGNRQQSRFLALVSNYDLLKANQNVAAESEDTGTLQALKALDSLESKLNQVQVAYQQFYTTIGIEDVWKGFLDGAKNVINTLNSFPKLFGKIPVGAVAAIYNVITLVKSVLLSQLEQLAAKWKDITNSTASQNTKTLAEGGRQSMTAWVESAVKTLRESKGIFAQSGEEIAQTMNNAINNVEKGSEAQQPEQAKDGGAAASKTGLTLTKKGDLLSKIGTNAGMVLTSLGLIIDKSTRAGEAASGVFTAIGGGLQTAGAAARLMEGDISALPQVLSGIMNIMNGIDLIWENDTERLERLTKEAENLNNEAKKTKAEYNTIQRTADKYDELKKKRNDSAEAAQEYQDAVDELAAAFPELIDGFDESGNVILRTIDLEDALKQKRLESAEASYAAARAEQKRAAEQAQQANKQLTNLSSPVGFDSSALTNYKTFAFTDYNEKIATDVDKKRYDDDIAAFNEALSAYKNFTGDFGSDEGIKIINDFIDQSERMKQAYGNIDYFSNFFANLYDSEYGVISKLQKDLPQLVKYNQINTGATKSVIGQWLLTNNTLTSDQYKAFSGNTALRALATQGITTDVGKLDWDTYLADETKDPQAIVERYADFYNKLGDEAYKQFEAMFASGDYTAQDFKTTFKDLPDEIANDLVNYYKTTTDRINGEMHSALTNLANSNNYTLTTDAKAQLTNLENGNNYTDKDVKILKQAQTEAERMSKAGLTDNANSIINSTIGILDAITQISTNAPKTAVAVRDAIINNGLSTTEGINAAIKELKGYDPKTVGPVIEALNSMKESIIMNVALSVQAFTSSVLSGWDDTKKGYEKLKSGMSYSEMASMINSGVGGLTLDSFYTTDGGTTWKATADGLKDYWDAVVAQTEKVKELQRQLVDGTKEIQGITVDENQKVTIDKDSFTDWLTNKDNTTEIAKLAERFGVTLTGQETPAEKFAKFNAAIIKAFDAYHLVNGLLEHEQDELEREQQWREGNYKKYPGLMDKLTENVRLLDQQTDGVLVKGIQFAQNSVKTLLTDIAKYGGNGINLNNYEGIPDNVKADIQKQINSGVSRTDIITAYAKYMGATFEETAQLVNQAIEAESKKPIDLLDYPKILNDPSSLDVKKFDETFKLIQEETKQFSDLEAEKVRNIVRHGGQAAVNILTQMGRDLTADEIKTLYQAEVTRIKTAEEQLTAKIGDIVTGDAVTILESAGYTIQKIGEDGKVGIVKGLSSIEAAYRVYFNKLKKSNEATLADLNNATAKILSVKNGRDKQQAAIDAIGDAASMNYERLGEIFTEAGSQLTEEYAESLESRGIIKNLGGNKLAITDFEEFAKELQLDTNSEQYVSAFKTYNDSLIKMNRQAERNILEELKNITTAKTGDWINLTEFTNSLGQEALKLLTLNLSQQKATLAKGLLKIEDGADIPAIIQELINTAKQSGNMLDSELDQLADTLADALKNYAQLLNTGIQGNLSNVQAGQLRDWAETRGIDLTFIKTANGLKLSNDQAILLYNHLKNIDELAAKTTFDALRESLQKTGEDCENITKTMSKIKALEDEMKHTPVNTQLQERLDLYRQIAQEQMMDPEQYNFMGRSLPDGLKGPENYWNSVGSMFKAMNTAAKDGKMGIQDFYNMVNEMNNLAKISGTTIQFMGQSLSGELKDASDLIIRGFGYIKNIDGEGAAIDFKGFTGSFENGAADMAKGIDAGIKKMAESQIHMLDGVIALLETVVAVKKAFEPLDENGDMKISMPEIFVDEEGKFLTNDKGQLLFEKKYQEAVDSILKQAETNEDLKAGLKNLKVQGFTIEQLFEEAKDGVLDSTLSAEAYGAAIDAFYQMAMSNDWSLDNLRANLELAAQKMGNQTMEFEYKGTKIAVGYGTTLTAPKGKYYVDNKEYDDAESALKAQALTQFKNFKKGSVEIDKKGQASAKVMVGGTEFNIQLDEDGTTINYVDDNGTKMTEQEVFDQAYQKWKEKQPESAIAGKTDKELKQEFRLKEKVNLAVDQVEITNPEAFAALTHEKVAEGAQYLLNGELDKAVELAGKYGVEVKYDPDVGISEESYKKLLEIFNVEDKNVKLQIAADTTGENSEVLAKILSGQSIDVTVNLKGGEDSTGLNILKTGEAGGETGVDIPILVSSITAKYIGETGEIKILDQSGAELVSVGSAETQQAAGTIGVNNLTAKYDQEGKTLTIYGADGTTPITTLENIADIAAAEAAIAGLRVFYDQQAHKIFLRNSDGTLITALENIQQITTGSAALAGLKVTFDPNTQTATIIDAEGKEVTKLTNVKTPEEVSAALAEFHLIYDLNTGTSTLYYNGAPVQQVNTNPVSAEAAVTQLYAYYNANEHKLVIKNGNDTVTEVDAANELDAKAKLSDIYASTATGTAKLYQGEKELGEVVLDKDLTGKGQVSQINLSWLGTQNNYNWDEILPKDGLKTEAQTVTIPVSQVRVELTDFQKQGIAIRQQITEAIGGNLERSDAGAFLYSALNPAVTINDYGHKQQTELRDSSNQFAQDVYTYVKDALNNVQHNTPLGANDLLNLHALSKAEVSKWFTVDGQSLSSVIGEILGTDAAMQDAGKTLFGDLTTSIQEIDPTKLQAVADALKEINANANSVNNIKWSAIADGINSINKPVENENNVLGIANTLTKTIDATVKLKYDPEAGKELIEQETLSRNIDLIPNVDKLNAALQDLTATVNLTGAGGAPAAAQTATKPSDNGTSNSGGASTKGATSMMSALATALEGAGDLFVPIQTAISNVTSQSSDSAPKIQALADAMSKVPGDASTKIGNLNTQLILATGLATAFSASMSGVGTSLQRASEKIEKLSQAILLMPEQKNIAITATVAVQATGGTVTSQSPGANETIDIVVSQAKGNVALAKGRKTLVGELGAELIVSNGRYFVAGQNGAEMINLPDDAIVFNHLQTQQLLGTGSTSRGKPVTNEKKAVAFARGNITGPAFADPETTLASLKQIRAMWKAMLTASLQELGQQAGMAKPDTKKKSGGGGSNKNNDDKTAELNLGYIADLERWYNLLRQIEKLEKDISYEEKLRAKLQSDTYKNGYAYYNSQKRSLENLREEIIKNKELSELQKSYYDARREDLRQSAFGKIFTFNENGLMQYNDNATMANGDRGGLFALAKINAQDVSGAPKYTAREQYALLQQWGFGDLVNYNSKGKAIKFTNEKGEEREDAYTEAVQAFWDKIDAWKDELDNLYDSYNEKLSDILDEESKRNDILKAMNDNQLSLEQKVLKAIEDSRQTEIDELQKERDALEKSTSEFIDGLSDQLNRERQMYKDQQEEQELTRMQRQLAILRRTGGSANQINSLQQQIDARQQEMYFDAQQKQIDAIKEASDKELERLDAQISLMTETLAYQKEHGLLWSEVYRVMSLSEAEIQNFVYSNGKDWWAKSTLQVDNDLNELKKSIQEWIARREDKERREEQQHNWETYTAAAKGRYGEVWTDENVAAAYDAFLQEYQTSGDPNRAGAAANEVLKKKLEEKRLKDEEEARRRQEEEEANKPQVDPNATGNNNNASNRDKRFSPFGKGGYGGIPEGKAQIIVERWGGAGGGWHIASEPYIVEPGVHYATTYRRSYGGQQCTGYYPHKLELAAGETGTFTFEYLRSDYEYGEDGRVREVMSGKAVPGYASGGMNKQPGLAMLHGTKTRPEAIMNAEQTKVWKEDIMSGKSTSLTSLLANFRSSLADFNINVNNADTNNAPSSGITIENAAVNMNVAAIKNDYDARRAGEQALEEMVRIARKTGAQSVRR